MVSGRPVSDRALISVDRCDTGMGGFGFRLANRNEIMRYSQSSRDLG